MKSEIAFKWTAERLFECFKPIYFWTFTYRVVMPDWWYSRTWASFIRKLQDCYGGTLKGVKVLEFHKDHGVHYHALLNNRVPVWLVRRLAKKSGMGRVQVKKANAKSIAYLAKYLSKQMGRDELGFSGGARWGTVGGFKGCRVRDIEIESPYTSYVALAREYLEERRIPFDLAMALREPGLTWEQVDRGLKRYVQTRSVSGIWGESGTVRVMDGPKFKKAERKVSVCWVVCGCCGGAAMMWDDGIIGCDKCGKWGKYGSNTYPAI